MQGSVNARDDVSRAYANARDTRKDAMTNSDFKEVVPYATHPPEPRNRPSPDQRQERPGTSYRGRLRVGDADARRHVAGYRPARSATRSCCQRWSRGFRPSLTGSGWTGPTCAPRCAPRSPRTPTASQTRCGTSGTNWTRLRASLRTRGGHGDQLPQDAPASSPRAAWRPSADDGHQHRGRVPRDRGRAGGAVGLAVPLRARAPGRHRCPDGGRLVAARTTGRTGG